MNKFCSIFSQLLQLFSRVEFQQAVKETQAERHARGFTCWGQFVAMLFCQLGRAHSLREITGGLRSYEGKLIAMLILRFLQLRSQFHWSLSNLVALLRMNLFTHRDLWAWLNKPFDVLPIPYESEQLKLQFA